MASSGSHFITSEALIRFRYYYIVITFGKEVVFQIFKNSFLAGSTKSILDILQDSCVPLGKKSNFTKEDLKRLSTEAPEAWDITVVYKICEALWEKNVRDPGDNLKKLMKAIKDERNKVSHKECSFSQSELRDKLREFSQILQDALDEAKILFSVHRTEIDLLKTKVQEAISKVTEKIREKYEPSSQDDMKKLKAEIEEFGDELHEYIQNKARMELTSNYSVLCRILPFDWLVQYMSINPWNFSVSLKMDTDREFHWGLSSQDTVILDQKDLLQIKNPDGNDPEVIILSGEAGSGKTTILSSITEKWNKEASDMPKLSSFRSLLYMQFRTHDHDNFDDYLRDLLQCTILDFNFDLVKSSVLQSECLILCDGYDEANDSSLKLFDEILALKIAKKKIVVTTRQVNTDKLTRRINKTKHHRVNLSILGFQREDMESHIKSLTAYLKKDETDKDETVNKMTQVLRTISPSIRQILKTPLWFNMFFLLQIECPEAVGDLSCMASFYLQMKKQNEKRLEEKLEITDDTIASFDKVYRVWSLKYFLHKKYELSQDDVSVFKISCKELGLEFDSIMSSYFTVKYSRKSLDIKKVYCYKHRSEQEFNAAYAICDSMIESYRGKENQIEVKENAVMFALRSVVDTVTMKEFDQSKYSPMRIDFGFSGILPFITGILYNNKKNLLYTVFGDILEFFEPSGKELFMHLTEASHDDYVKSKVKGELKRVCEGNTYYLEVSNNVTLSCLPSMLPELTPCVMRIALSHDDLEEPNRLIETLEIANKCSIEISLHDFLKSNSSMEKYLEKAKTCVGFTARLTRSGIEAMPTCMERLDVKVDLKDLEYLSSRLKDLEKLVDLSKCLFFSSRLFRG